MFYDTCHSQIAMISITAHGFCIWLSCTIIPVPISKMGITRKRSYRVIYAFIFILEQKKPEVHKTESYADSHSDVLQN